MNTVYTINGWNLYKIKEPSQYLPTCCSNTRFFHSLFIKRQRVRTSGKQHHLRNTRILFPVKPSEKPVSSLTKNNNLSQTQLSRIQTDYSEGTNDNVILAIMVGKSTQDERHLRLPLLLLSSVFQAEAKQSAGMSEVCNEKCIIPDCRASSRSIRNCKMRKPTGRWMDLIFGDFAWFCNSFFC